MNYRELTNEQRRQWLDFMQVDEEFRDAIDDFEHRYKGSMRWLNRSGTEYLHHKRGHTEKSLGPKGADTEEIYQTFTLGRRRSRDRLDALKHRLEQMAPVNRALALARVPKLTAKILRVLDSAQLLGTHLFVVGTNAMWAYEAKAGLQFQGDVMATADADMLWDPRKKMKLLSLELKAKGILGLLRKVDQSFDTRGKRDFRAVNSSGFSVDLIRPEDKLFFKEQRDHLTACIEDIAAAPIFGLQWLLNAPRFIVRAIAEDGLSVRIPTVDPRAFSLHKLWLSENPRRDPIKKPRDREQGQVVAKIARIYLNLDFDEKELQALPMKLRDLITNL